MMVERRSSKLKNIAKQIIRDIPAIGADYLNNDALKLVKKYQLTDYTKGTLPDRSWRKIIQYVMEGNGDDIIGVIKNKDSLYNCRKNHMAKSSPDNGRNGGLVHAISWDVIHERKSCISYSDRKIAVLFSMAGSSPQIIAAYLNTFYDSEIRTAKTVSRMLTNYSKEQDVTRYQKGDITRLMEDIIEERLYYRINSQETL